MLTTSPHPIEISYFFHAILLLIGKTWNDAKIYSLCAYSGHKMKKKNKIMIIIDK
jgi:hypothetical protein